jgi:hypothetical protein
MERTMRKRVLAAILIALAAAPGLLVLAASSGHAQFKGAGDRKEAAPPPKKQDDSQYKAAIERMPEKKFDPWQNMR